MNAEMPAKSPDVQSQAAPSDPAWARAKKVCQLNLEEVRMAKELGFRPETLIRNVPQRKQKWKLPVSLWICSRYEERHPGKGFRPEPPPEAMKPLSPEEIRAFEEQMYWEDYADRNDPQPAKANKKRQTLPVATSTNAGGVAIQHAHDKPAEHDEDLPF
jgi:hypothetical protein